MIGSYDGVSEVLFSRQAETVDDAVQSAIEDVERISGVRVIGLRDESFWSLADIAEYSRHTPDEIRALIAQSTGTGFPQHLSDPGEPNPLWRAQEIVDWFQDQVGESVAHPAAAVFTALADTLQARSNRRQVEQQERVTGCCGARQAYAIGNGRA